MIKQFKTRNSFENKSKVSKRKISRDCEEWKEKTPQNKCFNFDMKIENHLIQKL